MVNIMTVSGTDIKWHRRYIDLAKKISSWSKDPSTKVGAVAVSPRGQLLASGYNGFPRGILDTPERYHNRQVKYQYVVHAEMNCIYNATYNGVTLDGSYMYIWGLPMCSECSKGIIQVGVEKVFWSTSEPIPENWSKSLELTSSMLSEAGVQIHQIVI